MRGITRSDLADETTAHKTVEGTRIQLEAGGGVRAVICSTMVEVWQVVRSGLVNEGKVDDVSAIGIRRESKLIFGQILYSMPIGSDRIEELDQIQKEVQGKAVVRVMVDHAEQIRALEEFNSRTGRKENWTAFLKVDGGGRWVFEQHNSPSSLLTDS
jgi:D-serine deaminase-like pyridoxal phosphate-dependent protein